MPMQHVSHTSMNIACPRHPRMQKNLAPQYLLSTMAGIHCMIAYLRFRQNLSACSRKRRERRKSWSSLWVGSWPGLRQPPGPNLMSQITLTRHNALRTRGVVLFAGFRWRRISTSTRSTPFEAFESPNIEGIFPETRDYLSRSTSCRDGAPLSMSQRQYPWPTSLSEYGV